jgi:agmatine/peptidylarginine deiminase
MTDSTLRLPAEWEPQAAVLIAWPHADTDWAERLEAVESTYVALAAAVTRFQPLIIVVAGETLRAHVMSLLQTCQCRSLAHPFCRAAVRRYMAARFRPDHPDQATGNRFQLTDFRFTGWGGKFGAEQDDALIGGLVDAGVFGSAAHKRIDWALEGGGIESDGAGTILTTWRCLVQRHPEQSRDEMSAILRERLIAAARAVAGLRLSGRRRHRRAYRHAGALRAGSTRIVFRPATTASDVHYDELQRMGEELAALRTSRWKAVHALSIAVGETDRGRWPPSGRLVRQLSDRQRRRAGACLWRQPPTTKPHAIIGEAHPGRDDRTGAVPPADLAERQPALHHHAASRRAGLKAHQPPSTSVAQIKSQASGRSHDPQDLKVALLQETDRGSRDANLDAIEAGLREAAAAGVELVLLQELHNGPYFCQHESVEEFDQAETIPGPARRASASSPRS